LVEIEMDEKITVMKLIDSALQDSEKSICSAGSNHKLNKSTNLRLELNFLGF